MAEPDGILTFNYYLHTHLRKVAAKPIRAKLTEEIENIRVDLTLRIKTGPIGREVFRLQQQAREQDRV